MTGAVAVGLDIGTTGVKALAVDARGAVVARAESHYGLSQPQPGWSEQAPADWWAGTEAAIAALGPLEVAGIGLSGQMHGLVALDERERVLRPAILWNDQRTAAECAEIERRVGLERLIALTGNRALTGFTAPKLLWMRTHEPEVYARIRHVLLPKDYVRLRLCGERAIDVADASGHAALRRRRASLLGAPCSTRSSSRGVDAARARVARGLRSHAGGRAGGRGRGRLRRRRARRRRRAPRARSRSCSAPRASSSPPCPPTSPIRRRACTSSATRCRAAGTRWA